MNLRCDRTAAWAALQGHYEAHGRDLDLREAFARDAGRAAAMSFEAPEVFADLSKNRLDTATLKFLLELARECGLEAARDAMFAGQSINATEGRAVLHTALRAPRGHGPFSAEVHGVLDSMLAYAEGHPEIGVLGPQLRYGDGRVQSSRRRFPTLATFFLESTVLQREWPRNRVLDRYFVLDKPDDAISQVDWVVGACMLVRRAVLDAIGGFDESFFMYSEELDLCHRAVDAGWQVVYFPQAVVTHHEGKSSEQVVAARHIRFHTSRVRYVRKYHGAAAAEAVRTFLLLTFAFQWVEEGAKWLAGLVLPAQRSKRAMRRERMAAYGQVLRSGLSSKNSI